MANNKKPYIVQIKKGSKWKYHSDHNWDEMAIINANSVSSCRKVRARVIFRPKRKVIFEVGNE